MTRDHPAGERPTRRCPCNRRAERTAPSPHPAGPPPGGVPERHRADHGRRAHRPARRRRPGGRRAHRGGGARPGGTRGHGRDRRERRHPDAGHDRHAPAHVADRDARLRRRLDADPVLRLVLPELGQGLPAAGHLRGQPAVRDRVGRRRRHHHGRLVARAADDRPRGRGHRRAGGGARPVRAGLRQHPAGPLGVVGHARVPRLPTGAGSTARATCSASRWRST